MVSIKKFDDTSDANIKTGNNNNNRNKHQSIEFEYDCIDVSEGDHFMV